MDSVTVRDRLMQLAESGDRPLYVIAPGNAGDTLITAGFFQLANEVGLRYTATTPLQAPVQGRTVIFGGGGALGGGWTNAYRDMIAGQAATGSTVLVMPQTVQGNEEFLASLGPNVTLFARERRSHAHVMEHTTGGCVAALDHDTAFHLDARAFIESYRPRASYFSVKPKELARRVLYARAMVSSLASKHVKAFRVDIEANDTAGVSRRIWRDLPLVAFFGNATEDQSQYTAYKFLKLLDRFDAIETDRLHVAVGAAKLGKDVTLFDNSYFKCRAVYEMSMDGLNVEMRSFA